MTNDAAAAPAGDAADPRPGFYYVTVVDGPRVGRLAGPFPTHGEALATVSPARDRACDVDPWATFYAFGTARYEQYAGPGVLNADLGIEANRRAAP